MDDHTAQGIPSEWAKEDAEAMIDAQQEMIGSQDDSFDRPDADDIVDEAIPNPDAGASGYTLANLNANFVVLLRLMHHNGEIEKRHHRKVETALAEIASSRPYDSSLGRIAGDMRYLVAIVEAHLTKPSKTRRLKRWIHRKTAG